MNKEQIATIIETLLSTLLNFIMAMVILYFTIANIKETGDQVRADLKKAHEQISQMLTSMQQFAGERKEAVGSAIDSIAKETKNIKLEGKLDVVKTGKALFDKWKKKDEN